MEAPLSKKKNHCCILQLFITIPYLTLYKEKYPTEKSEQIRSQCTYDQQQWHPENTGGGLTL